MTDLTDAELDALESLHLLCDCPDPIPHCLECSSHQQRRKQDGGEMFVSHAVQLPCPSLRLIAEVRRWRAMFHATEARERPRLVPYPRDVPGPNPSVGSPEGAHGPEGAKDE